MKIPETKTKPFTKVPNEVWDRSDISGSEKLVFIALCRHYYQEFRRSCPSLSMIENETGLSRPWVIKCVNALVSYGLVEKHVLFKKGTEYFIPSLEESVTTTTESTLVNSVYQPSKVSLPVKLTEFTRLVNSVNPNNTNKTINNTNKTNIYTSQDPPEQTALVLIPEQEEQPKPKRKRKPKANPEFEQEFEQIYEAYPYSQYNNKARGKSNYVKLREQGVPFDELMTSVKNYAQQRRGEDPKYTKGVGNFFSDRNGVWQNFTGVSEAPVTPITQSSSIDEYMRDLSEFGFFDEGDAKR